MHVTAQNIMPYLLLYVFRLIVTLLELPVHHLIICLIVHTITITSSSRGFVVRAMAHI